MFRERGLSQLGVGFARSPRAALFAVIALKFGATADTDSFLLIYSGVLFIAGIISYGQELFTVGWRASLLAQVFGALAVVGLGLIANSTLVLLFVPYLVASNTASGLLGRTNRLGIRWPLIVSGWPHLIGAGVMLLTPASLQQVIIILTVVECGRVGVLVAPNLKRGSISKITSTSGTMGLLLAVTIGGASGLIEKAFAYTLEVGATTVISYSSGGIGLLTAALTYGITLAKVRDPDSRTPLGSLGVISIGVFIVGSIVWAILNGWQAQVGVLFMILSPRVLLAGHASALRAVFIEQGRWRLILGLAICFTGFNTLLAWGLLRFGVYGLAIAALVSQVGYGIVITSFDRSQRDYFTNRIAMFWQNNFSRSSTSTD